MDKPTYKDVTFAVTFEDKVDCFDHNDVVRWEGVVASRRVIEQLVDEELGRFEQFAMGLGMGPERTPEPLSRPERAILKTYLGWKLGMASSTVEPEPPRAA